MIWPSTFAESERLQKEFSRLAGGSFSIVYRALCDASREAGSNLLDRKDVADRIREIMASE